MKACEEKAYKTIATWLLDKDWRWHHRVAMATNWDWDGGLALLEWIVHRKQCCAETALELFWLAALEFNSIEDLKQSSVYGIVAGVAEGFRQGRYRWSGEPYGFDPINRLSAYPEWHDIEALWIPASAKFPAEPKDEPPPSQIRKAFAVLGSHW